jgi:tRNA(Phe) wybutosine-synthesizing methylase Tyw3
MKITDKKYQLMLQGVDEEIRDLVDVLNKNGYETVASCSGHGKMIGNIALRDGRELMIVEKFNKARLIEKVLIEKGIYQPTNERGK